jgi:hypothetical protein
LVTEHSKRFRRFEIAFNTLFVVMALAGAWQIIVATENFFRAFGAFLLLIGGTALLWPRIRLLEGQQLKFTHLKSRAARYTGLLVPASLTERIVFGTILFCSAAFTIGMAPTSTEPMTKLKLWSAGGLCLFILFCLVISNFRNKPGILLTAEGIVWHEALTSPAFIPWPTIFHAMTFNNVVQFTSTPCFGLLIEDVNAIEASPGRRENCALRFAANGCHFVYVSENLRYPSEALATIINYYLDNPERRPELSNGVALSRISEILQRVNTASDSALVFS